MTPLTYKWYSSDVREHACLCFRDSTKNNYNFYFFSENGMQKWLFAKLFLVFDIDLCVFSLLKQRQDSSEAWPKKGIQHRERSCWSKWRIDFVIPQTETASHHSTVKRVACFCSEALNRKSFHKTGFTLCFSRDTYEHNIARLKLTKSEGDVC